MNLIESIRGKQIVKSGELLLVKEYTLIDQNVQLSINIELINARKTPYVYVTFERQECWKSRLCKDCFINVIFFADSKSKQLMRENCCITTDIHDI